MIEKRPQRIVLCHLVVDIMRNIHAGYFPANEPFGSRLETAFIGICVAIGDMEGRPFSVAKIASYMRTPRTTVIRRLDRLARWGLIKREGRNYYVQKGKLNSLLGMRSYKLNRRLIDKASEELSILDTLPD
jgi:hypothetical protein